MPKRRGEHKKQHASPVRDANHQHQSGPQGHPKHEEHEILEDGCNPVDVDEVCGR
jgi:hypothetical protein